MAREPGLRKANERITIWHRLFGRALAPKWSLLARPPLGAGSAGFYAHALRNDLEPEARSRIARCLLWCDAQAGQYVPARLEGYREAARAFPQDERCVFFAAALCRQGALNDPGLASQIYTALLRAEWAESSLWAAFDLPQRALTDELARLYARDKDVSPERVAAVEDAYRRAPDRSLERSALAGYLSRAYRQQDRADEEAQNVYAVAFAANPDDGDNTAFLAGVFAAEERTDLTACRVYARMARNDWDGYEWVIRLARAHVAAGRVDGDALPVLRRAAALLPEDTDLAAGVAMAGAQQASPDEATQAELERALGREAELLPVFWARDWRWEGVARALALAWGRAGRVGERAVAVYARAADLCPGDKRLAVFHARALAAGADYSEASAAVYEKGLAAAPGEHDLLVALGHAYVACGAQEGARRGRAIDVWENLYRQGTGWPEMVEALALAYTGDDRVSDVALALWTGVVEASPKNGKLRARLGREWKARGDRDVALKWYREAAKLLPRDFEAQYEAGRLLQECSGDNAAAETLLRKAVKLNAGHLGAHVALGEVLLAQNKRDEAKAVFQHVVDDIDRTHTPSLLRLASLNLRYEERGVLEASALFEQAKNLDPDRPETHRRLADLYREQGQHVEEEKALEKYLALSAGADPHAHRQLADLYIRRGDYIRAESALRRVIALGAGDRKTYTLLGEVMVQGRGKAA